MKTIALRFADRFAPPEGTIKAHQQIIQQNGFVWYGKLGTPLSISIRDEIMKNEKPRILLIHSARSDRYWAYIDSIQKEKPDKNLIPSYYRDNTDNFRTWFRVYQFEPAPANVLSLCIVPSSGNTLSYSSKHSMSPYYIIEYNEPDRNSDLWGCWDVQTVDL